MWFTLAVIALAHGGISFHSSFLPTTNTNRASVSVAKSSTKTDAASSSSGSQTQSKSIKTSDQTSSSSKQKFEVQFHGLTALGASDALKVLRENGLSEKNLPGDEELLRYASVVTDALKSKGYFSARVDVSAKGRTINFYVSEGTRSTISRIQFAGNQAFSREELGAKFNECLESYHPDGYNRELIDYCRHLTLNFMRSRGYLQAMMESSVSVSDTGVELSFKVNEGKVFRLGKIRMTGVKAFEVDDLRSRLPIHEGEIALGELIATWVFEDLRNAYGERGYIQYTAEPIPTFREGVVDFEIVVDEGNRFSISSISCLTEGRLDPTVVSLLTIRQGDYYDERRFQESIERLNSSGMFAEIDPSRDVEFKTSDDNQRVALTIKLHTKQ